MEDSRDRAQRALDDLEREVLRAASLIAELRSENEALRRQVKEVGKPAIARRTEGWDDERREWTTERQVIADRLKTILGRFQWLEGGPP